MGQPPIQGQNRFKIQLFAEINGQGPQEIHSFVPPEVFSSGMVAQPEHVVNLVVTFVDVGGRTLLDWVAFKI